MGFIFFIMISLNPWYESTIKMILYTQYQGHRFMVSMLVECRPIFQSGGGCTTFTHIFLLLFTFHTYSIGATNGTLVTFIFCHWKDRFHTKSNINVTRVIKFGREWLIHVFTQVGKKNPLHNTESVYCNTAMKVNEYKEFNRWPE